MNGRLYDPKLRRFLQPDNNIQDPFNSQNYNRYSYVLNNPLKYTDPSGEFWQFLAGFIFSAYIHGGAASGEANPLKWNFSTWSSAFTGTASSIASGYATGRANSYIENYNNKPVLGASATGSDYIQYNSTERSNTSSFSVITGAIPLGAGATVAESVLTWISIDVSIPDPTDVAWPKWVGYGIVGGAAAAYLYSGDYVEKMNAEIDRITRRKSDFYGMTYELTVRKSGVYKTVRGMDTYLQAGDVWKYGETTSLNRYSDLELNTMVNGGVRMTPLYTGSLIEIKVKEKYLIYGYFLTHGFLPPGNRIFR